MSFRIRAGKVTGRAHLIDGRNCQDAFHHLQFEVNGSPYYVGVVADGCGEGYSSEAGACLAAPFICQSIRNSLRNHVPLADVPNLLVHQLRRFLSLLLDAYAFTDEIERETFIHRHLLFTLVGFVITPQQTLAFLAGDGVIQLNDTIYSTHEEAPSYITYPLVRQSGQTVDMPCFTLYEIPTASLQRLLVATDAWADEPELLAQVWQGSTPASLQRLLNRWSDAQHFRDDATIITVARLSKEEA
jgi:hypothetical protein